MILETLGFFHIHCLSIHQDTSEFSHDEFAEPGAGGVTRAQMEPSKTLK